MLGNGSLRQQPRIQLRYGAEGEEIYETAYWAAQGCPEDTELLASKWGYKFGKFGRPTKIEMEYRYNETH